MKSGVQLTACRPRGMSASRRAVGRPASAFFSAARSDSASSAGSSSWGGSTRMAKSVSVLFTGTNGGTHTPSERPATTTTGETTTVAEFSSSGTGTRASSSSARRQCGSSRSASATASRSSCSSTWARYRYSPRRNSPAASGTRTPAKTNHRHFPGGAGRESVASAWVVMNVLRGVDFGSLRRLPAAVNIPQPETQTLGFDAETGPGAVVAVVLAIGAERVDHQVAIQPDEAQRPAIEGVRLY